MASLNGVNTNATPQSAPDYEAVPKGWYKGVIESEEVKTGKNSGVNYLQFKVKIIEGPHKNRVVWPMLHLWSTSSFVDKKTGETKYVKDLAAEELAAIKVACGKQQIQDTVQLHMIPLEFFTIPKEDEYGSKNEVKGWRPIKSAAPTVGGNSKPSIPPTSSPTSSGATNVKQHEDDVPF